MAITKLRPITKTLQLAVDYISNNLKTYNNLLVSSFECTPNSAEFDFNFIKSLAKNIKGDYSKVGGKDILAWQIIQSFSPDDNITPKEAHNLGKELANKFLKDDYQYVIGTHIDKNHIHNHIIFNSISHKTLKSFRTKKNIEHLRLRDISNSICKKYNLSTIEYPNKKTKNNKKLIEVNLNNKDKSFKTILKNDIDNMIYRSINFEDFLNNMIKLGYEVDTNINNIGFKNYSQKYYTRLNNLDENYSKNNIIKKIDNNSSLKKKFEEIHNKKYINIFSDTDLIEPKKILEEKIPWREKLKYCIDYFIFNCNTYEEFLQGMRSVGYKIKFGKHIAFRCNGMDKNIRAKVLGEDYTEEKIIERIQKENKVLPKIPFFKNKQTIKREKERQNINLSIQTLIETDENEKYKNNIAYKKFIEKFNANQIIATINFMKEHNYDDIKLIQAINDIEKEKINCKKDLEYLKSKFKELQNIKITEENKNDYDLALKNLENLKNKVNKKLDDLNIQSLEHKTVAKNRNIDLQLKVSRKNQTI